MKILVVSDSHGFYNELERLVCMHPDAQIVIHLGDGVEEARLVAGEHPEKRFVLLRGNCDRFDAPHELVECADGVRIFCTHGHAYDVKSSELPLVRAAEKNRADVVAFGHTHTQYCALDDGVWYINPGSLVFSKRGSLCFGVIDIGERGVYCYVSEAAVAHNRR